MATRPPLPVDSSLPAEALLTAWLATATHRLCDDARERIKMEICRHVMEMAAALQTDGYTTEAAYEEAVCQLGNPKAAGRKFRWTNLTAREDRLLCRMAEAESEFKPPSIRVFAYSAVVVESVFVLFFFIMPWLLFSEIMWPGWTIVIAIHGLLAFIFVLTLIKRDHSTGVNPSLSLAVSIGNCPIGMFLAWIVLWPGTDAATGRGILTAITLVFFLVMATVNMSRFALLWWKLGRVPADRMRFG